MCGKDFNPVCKGKKSYKNFCQAFCEGCSGEEVHSCDNQEYKFEKKFKTVE